MRHGIMLIVVIILIIVGYSGYQHYAEYRSRSERISLLMEYANTTDYDKASLFDEKYNHLALNGKYNQSVLEFFSHWLLNNSLDYTQYLYERQKFERVSYLMKHANTTDYDKAFLFDEKYSYMVNASSYNQSVSEFFSYWLLNQSLAETCLGILGTVEATNTYLSELKSHVTNYGSKDNLTLILSVFTDREEYRAGDEINFTITVLSSDDLGKVPINIFGFQSRYGRYVVNNKWINYTGLLEIPIKKGLNIKSFMIDIPACSPCTGVYPGIHSLTCVIVYNGLNVNATKILSLGS